MYKNLISDLVKIFNDGAYLSITLDNSLKSLNLNDADRKIYTKILYGVVENKLLLDYNLAPLIKGKRVKPYPKCALRIGVYVIDFLNIKDYFIVNKLVDIIKKTDYKTAMFVNAVLRSYCKTEKPSISNLDTIEYLSIKYSIPKDITSLLYKQYGIDIFDSFISKESFNIYRINTLKTNENQVKELLKDFDIKVSGNALISKQSLINTSLFKEGLLIAQDISSMKVAEVLNPIKGSKILDVCAAPGGKSLYAATLMENIGSITSCDIYDEKLKKINDNAIKLGITIIKTLNADATNFDYKETFDYVICDVPCSGLGVIRHKPDLKYRITLNDILDIVSLQKSILSNASKFVKLNGILLYSTCTINKEENENQINEFLLSHPEYKKIEEYTFLPSDVQDGFYICKLERVK